MSSDEDNKLKDLTARLDNELHLTNSHDLKLGLGISGLNVHYFATMNDTTLLVGRETKAIQGSWYLQDLWKLTRDIELTAGLRGTYYDKTAKNYLEPRASFFYSVSPTFKLKGAWGRYYQFVNRIANENVLEGSRDFWIPADKELEPGFAEHWILGGSLENRDYLLDIEGYYKDLDKLVEYSRRVSYKVENTHLLKGTGFFQGTGFSRGMDLLIQKKTGRINGWIGYSLGKVEYKFPELNHGKPYPAPHDRTHEVNIVGNLTLKKWDFSATWVFATGKAYTAPESQYFFDFLDGSKRSYIHISDKNTFRLPAYHRLDLSISRKFETQALKYVFGLSIFNLYNHTNLWYRQYNLDTVPIAVSDVTMLGFTPTVFFQIYSR